MSDGESCGRRIYAAPESCDNQSVCLMHSGDPKKPQDEFNAEIKAILAGTSPYHRPNDHVDFRRYVFLEYTFKDFIFSKYTDFGLAVFTEEANFYGATFTKEAGFGQAVFSNGANFFGVTFNEGGGFRNAIFRGAVYFTGAKFTKDTDFSESIFTGGA